MERVACMRRLRTCGARPPTRGPSPHAPAIPSPASPSLPLVAPAPQVRRLICQVLAKLYLLGDQLPLYSRVSSLQLFLGTRETFR